MYTFEQTTIAKPLYKCSQGRWICAPGSEHVPNCTLHIGLQQCAHFAVCTSCLSKGNFQPSMEVSTIYKRRVRSFMKTQLPLCKQEAGRPNSNAACKRDAPCISSQCEARVAASTLVASAACILRQTCLARRSACRQATFRAQLVQQW